MDDSELYKFLNIYNWEIIENQIYKKFIFKNFSAATRFYNLIADEADKQNHHPKVISSYNQLEVFLTTYDEKKITHKDIKLGVRINDLFNTKFDEEK
jgi:4a-hydroxytetrahydrobiopterin dehydratase